MYTQAKEKERVRERDFIHQLFDTLYFLLTTHLSHHLLCSRIPYAVRREVSWAIWPEGDSLKDDGKEKKEIEAAERKRERQASERKRDGRGLNMQLAFKVERPFNFTRLERVSRC